MKIKKVALFGGSFNPPHSGHFEMAKYIYETLEVDEVRFLFSVNWQKNKTGYESINHRMEMGRIMASHYPELPFVMSDIQDKLGTHMTYDVLKTLQEDESDTKFIWVMGADNLESFHTWENFEEIIENFPLAIVDRPPYTERAKKSFTALTYVHLQTSKAADLCDVQAGWHFLDNPQIEMSSSHILKQLRGHKKTFGREFQDVANYIKRHKLYCSKSVPMPSQTQRLTFEK